MTGNIGNYEEAIDPGSLGVEFTEKPILHGGAAMEYYGLRKRGKDYDFIVPNADYQALAEKYPLHKKDLWGDLGVLVGEYELFRSIYRFDYAFFAQGAIEYSKFKVISFERLYFLKSLSYKTAPGVWKLTNDYELMLNFLDIFRNVEYVGNAALHLDDYLAAPGGIIYNDKYK